METAKNSSRKTILQREWDSKINVTMPAGHTLPLTFAFDFTASYFRISSVIPEPVIFKRFRFRLRFRPQPSGSTGSGTGSASPLTTLSTHFYATNIPTPSVFALLPIQNSLYLLPIAPKNLHPEPLHRVSWTHATSVHLSANASTSSPDLPVSESTFQVPTLKDQPLHLSLIHI